MQTGWKTVAGEQATFALSAPMPLVSPPVLVLLCHLPTTTPSLLLMPAPLLSQFGASGFVLGLGAHSTSGPGQAAVVAAALAPVVEPEPQKLLCNPPGLNTSWCPPYSPKPFSSPYHIVSLACPLCSLHNAQSLLHSLCHCAVFPMISHPHGATHCVIFPAVPLHTLQIVGHKSCLVSLCDCFLCVESKEMHFKRRPFPLYLSYSAVTDYL